MTVVDGAVTDATVDGRSLSADQRLGYPMSVDELFDYADRNASAGKLELKYDDHLGYPVALGVDPDLAARDDEIRVAVTKLVPGAMTAVVARLAALPSLLVAASLLIAGCGLIPNPLPSGAARRRRPPDGAQQRWAEKAVDTYQLTMRYYCALPVPGGGPRVGRGRRGSRPSTTARRPGRPTRRT